MTKAKIAKRTTTHPQPRKNIIPVGVKKSQPPTKEQKNCAILAGVCILTVVLIVCGVQASKHKD